MTARGLLGEQGRGTQLKGLHLGSSRVCVLPLHSGDHQMLRRHCAFGTMGWGCAHWLGQDLGL